MTDVCRPTLLFPAALSCWCYHVFLHSGWAPQTSGLGTFAEGGIKGQASQMPFLQFLQDQGVAVWDAWIPHCEYSFRELKARLGAFTLPWVKQGTQGTLVVRFHHLLSCRLVEEVHRVRIVLAALLISSSCSGGSIVDWVSSFICEKASNKITTTNWKVQWCAQSVGSQPISGGRHRQLPSSRCISLSYSEIWFGSKGETWQKSCSVNPSTLVMGS